MLTCAASSQKIFSASKKKMAFYQLFIRLMKFNFIGAIIILILYLFLNDIVNLVMQLSKADVTDVTDVTLFPNNLEIIKIDVGQGDDIWILTADDNVNHLFIFLNKNKNFG